MSRSYRVLLFDLFGTVVHFRAPSADAARPSFEWLRGPLAAERPDLEFDAFRAALLSTAQEIGRGRAPEYVEVPSPERFRRTLARLDPGGGHQRAAEALTRAHMAHLASLTELPAGHGELLRDLKERYRLGMVSNFDHAQTARDVLARHRVAECFEVIVISAEFGRRKPHPSIFTAALARLDAQAGAALYVGDSPEDDIVGARAAGLDVAWINRGGQPPPSPAPTYTLGALGDLRALLAPPS